MNSQRLTEFTIHAAISLPAGGQHQVLHVLNVYLPPHCHLSAAQERSYWDVFETAVAELPSNSPYIIVGDFNAKIAHLPGFVDTLCPCHGLPRASLCGDSCDRGSRLLTFAVDRDLHFINGCPHLHTQATITKGSQDPEATPYTSTLDYILVN